MACIKGDQGAPSQQSPLEPTMALTTAVACLAAANFVVVDSLSPFSGLACAGENRVTTTEDWTCGLDGSAECHQFIEDCANDEGVGGISRYGPEGNFEAGGWDCRHKCRGNQGQSGSQSRTRFVSRPGGSAGTSLRTRRPRPGGSGWLAPCLRL